MIRLLPIIHQSSRPSVFLAAAILLLTGGMYFSSHLMAGTGGVEGGCAFPQTSNGVTSYKACTGANLPMWYSAGQNPTYNEGDFPCGTYGNQNCGVESGDPLNE